MFVPRYLTACFQSRNFLQASTDRDRKEPEAKRVEPSGETPPLWFGRQTGLGRKSTGVGPHLSRFGGIGMGAVSRLQPPSSKADIRAKSAVLPVEAVIETYLSISDRTCFTCLMYIEQHYCDSHDAWFPARGGCLFCLYDAGVIPAFEDEPDTRPLVSTSPRPAS